jgi:hypothetical protein
MPFRPVRTSKISPDKIVTWPRQTISFGESTPASRATKTDKATKRETLARLEELPSVRTNGLCQQANRRSLLNTDLDRMNCGSNLQIFIHFR